MSNLLEKLKFLQEIQNENKILNEKINEMKNEKAHLDVKNENHNPQLYTQSIENIIQNRKQKNGKIRNNDLSGNHGNNEVNLHLEEELKSLTEYQENNKNTIMHE